MKKIYTIISILIASISFAQNTVNYQYDNENRITSSDDGSKTQNYQYDNLGNRTNYVLTATGASIDLSVVNINIPNANVEQGQSYSVSCTVHNLGTANVGTSTLKVYLSPTATGTDTQVGAYAVSSILASASENVSLNISIPASATLGSQQLVFFIDATNSITETNEDNNKANIAVTVTAPNLAELNLQNVSLSANNTQAGNTIGVSATVYNEGTITANNFTVKSYLSINQTYEANDLLLSDANETYASLTANNNTAYNKTALIPSNTIAGNYYILFVVDKENTITEVNETNNVVAKPIIITGATNAPVASYTVTNQNVAVNTAVHFIDQSTNNPTSWQWTFEGGTPSTSTEQNPVVTYDTEGTFNVTLIASNASGSSTEERIDYITVGACQEDWINVGIEGFSSSSTSKLRFEIFDTIPYVLYRDADHSNKTTVMKYVNGAWELVGNAGFSHVGVYDIELAFANDGTPYVGYIDESGNHRISVKKFNGTSWVTVGALNFSGNTDYTFDMTIDNNGYPTVIYEDGSYGGSSNWYWELMVKKFNGSSWVFATTQQLERGSYADIKYDSNNILYVAYALDDTGHYARVKKLQGTSWITIGTTNVSQGKAESVNLVFDSNDVPYVAYSDDAYNDKTTVKKLQGTTWVTLGTNGFSPDDFTIYQKLAITSDNIPYISFRYYSPSTGSANRTAVMKYSGSSWSNVGVTDFTNSPAYGQLLALDSNDTPYLAYWDGSNASKVSVMKFACDTGVKADFYANATTGNTGSTFVLTDASTNNPTSWNWTITPSTFTYVNGTSSTSQNPEVIFNDAGQYSVTLNVSDSESSDSITKTDYIEITQPEPLTYVPDDIFEQRLIYYGYDDVLDDYVVTSNINTITSLNLNSSPGVDPSLKIHDLTGIEDFTSLTSLVCAYNNLSILDLSNNVNLLSLNCRSNSLNSINIDNCLLLEHLECSHNDLQNLNLLNNINLTYLNCSYNEHIAPLNLVNCTNLNDLYYTSCNATSLDVSTNTNLEILEIGINNISNLDISNNINLIELYCSYNNLSFLNTTNNTNLEHLSFSNNLITTIDLSNNSNITYLSCGNNYLDNLDVSNIPMIEKILCRNNNISSLDLHLNNHLEMLWCYSNNLTFLDLRNGANNLLLGNTGGSFAKFRANYNHNLICIYVDDVNWSTTNWTDIDNNSNFVETETECTALSVEEEFLSQNIQIYPNPTSSILNIEISNNVVIENMKVYDITGKLLNNYKGNPQSISVKDYASGVYFINIITKNGKVVKKIIKQ